MGQTILPENKPAHLYGLDTLRLVLASWVAMGHGAWIPLPDIFVGHGKLADAALKVPSLAFCGTLAVSIFFLISGLCIHYPHADKANLRWGPFLLGRFIRIGIPLAAISALCAATGLFSALDAVLWSVFCEIAYYALYPVIFGALNRHGWKLMLVSCLVSAGLLTTGLHKASLWEFGPLTWLYCYPLWIAGALIASNLRARPSLFPSRIWLWRLAAIAGCVVAMVARFHLHRLIGYPITIVPFSIFAFYWLQAEVGALGAHRPPAFLEHAGRASYTLYLVHNPVLVATRGWAEAIRPVTGLFALNLWLIQIAAIGAVTYLAFRCVEYPAHRLSRRISKLSNHARRDVSDRVGPGIGDADPDRERGGVVDVEPART